MALADTTMRTTMGRVARRFHLAHQTGYLDFPMGKSDPVRSVKDKRDAIKNMDALFREVRQSLGDHGGRKQNYQERR